jgi:hypothetical protein
MSGILRSIGAVALFLTLAGSVGATSPPEITLLAFEWREPFAFGWFRPNSMPTVTANSLVVVLAADATANTTQDARVDASPIITERWWWREDVSRDANLVW